MTGGVSLYSDYFSYLDNQQNPEKFNSRSYSRQTTKHTYL